jgi:predicted dienelactone hydrolase
MRRHHLLIALCLFSLATLSAPAATPPNPLTPGPYPVGVTTTVFVDQSRVDAVTKEPRTLVTEIWYPATDEARELPKNKFTDFMPGGISPALEMLFKNVYKLSSADLDRNFWNYAVRDARVRAGRFPLVIFSHGNGGTRHQNTFWCDYLASHGYIVASADHTGNAALTVIKGKVVFHQRSQREQSAKDRPQDLRFLLDQLTLWGSGADSRFAGRLDLSSVAAAGMSFGSYTAIRAADLDPRFKAVIGMAYAPSDGHTNLRVPTLLMLGAEDATIGESGNAAIRAHFSAHQGPVFLLEMKRGGHYSFTDMYKISRDFGDGVGRGRARNGEVATFTPMEQTYEMINASSVAFLGHYLKGESGYLSFLQRNHWPAEAVWKFNGLEAAMPAGQ